MSFLLRKVSVKMKSIVKQREKLVKNMNEKKLLNNISKNKVELYITNPRGYTLKTVEIYNEEHKKYIIN